MIKKIDSWIKGYQSIIILLIILGGGGAFGWRQLVLAETSQKQKTATEQIAQVALKLLDPKIQIKHYLLNKGADSIAVELWMKYPVGIPKHKGRPVIGTMFIDRGGLNEVGVLYKVVSDSTVKVFDTLWNYRSKK